MSNRVYKVVNAEFESCLAQGMYTRSYYIGNIVTAHPNTLGLMCFKTLKDCEIFKNFIKKSYFKILEVNGIGVSHVPLKIAYNCQEYAIAAFYHDLHYMMDSCSYSNMNLIGNSALEGTVCYQQVQVIRNVIDEFLRDY